MGHEEALYQYTIEQLYSKVSSAVQGPIVQN